MQNSKYILNFIYSDSSQEDEFSNTSDNPLPAASTVISSMLSKANGNIKISLNAYAVANF